MSDSGLNSVQELPVSGLGSAIRWLRDHDVSPDWIGKKFLIRPGYASVLAHREGRDRGIDDIAPVLTADLFAPGDPFALPDRKRFARVLGTRSAPYKLEFSPHRQKRISALEEAIEEQGINFWANVRFGERLQSLRQLREGLGNPSHFRLVRLLARLSQLTAEAQVHIGWAASAIREGLKSIQLSRISYHDSNLDPYDLTQLAKSALLVSQAYLLRLEPENAERYLALYMSVLGVTDQEPGGDYMRQYGTMCFQRNEDDLARRYLTAAARRLSETQDYGRERLPHEIKNIGERQINALGHPNWEAAQELFGYMVDHLRAGEIHISMNLNWMAATAFATDSRAAHMIAAEQLERYREASLGYGHQQTIATLLRMTIELEPRLRRSWARRILYENAFKNR